MPIHRAGPACLALALIASLPSGARAIDLDRLQEDAEQLLEDGGRALDDAGRAAGEAFGDMERRFDELVAQPLPPSAGWLASDLIGAPVRDAQGETLAEVADLVVSRDAGVPLAILRIGGQFGAGGRLVAVDFRQLAETAEGSGGGVTAFTLETADLADLPSWRVDGAQ